MDAYTIERELWVPYPLDVVFDFFSRPENLERITPPWLKFRILPPPPFKMQPGAKIRYALNIHGIPLVHRLSVKRDVERIFEYRARQVTSIIGAGH